MYVMSLKCDFGDFDERLVTSLTIWTMSALENDSQCYFSVSNIGWVSGGMTKENVLWFSALRYLYADQILFVDKYLSEGRKDRIPTFLNIKKGVTFEGHGRYMFGELWCMWRFLRWLEKCPFNKTSRRLVIIRRIFIWSERWYFHVKGANCFRFKFTESHIHCCFKLFYFYFNLDSEFVAGAHLIRGVHHKMLWRDRVYCLGHIFLIKTW